MKIKDILTKVRQSKTFLEWDKDNPDAYLAHLFHMQGEKASWHVGYFDAQKHAMTSFILENDDILVQPENDVLQKEHEAIRPIIIDDVKQDFEEIENKAEDFCKENYAKEYPLRSIYILQNLKGLGQVWNITLFTRTFNTLNMKFDAASGEIKSHELAKLFEMG